MDRLASWRFALVGWLGALLLIVPTITTAQPSGIEVTIDTPVTASTLMNGQSVEISGWAVDTSSESGTGIESVQIQLDSQNGVASEPLFANYGMPRPDVAQAYGR